MRLFFVVIWALFVFVSAAKADIDFMYATNEEVQEFLDNGNDVNKQDDNGKTIFMYHWKDIDLLKKFVKAGADLNIRDNSGETVIWDAVREDKKDIVEFLLDNGARVDLRNNSGEKIISTALYRPKILEIMLVKGAISEKDKRNLMIEAQYAYAKQKRGMDIIIGLLKKYGCSIIEREEDGSPILAKGIVYQGIEPDGIERLIKLGFNVNIQDKDGNTALMLTSYPPNVKRIKALLENGADPNIKNNKGETALVVQGHSIDIVRLLLDYGADINLLDKRSRNLFLFEFVNPSGPDKNKMCLDINETNPQKSKYDEVFEVLMKKGLKANLSIEDIASVTRSVVFCPYLLKKWIDYGADVNFQSASEGYTPLMIAIIHDGQKISSDSNTKRAYAPVESVKILLEAGADVNLRDRKGRTALDMATNQEKKDLLMQYGAK